MITTTLNRIGEHAPHEELWEVITKQLGEDFDRDKEFPLSLILESGCLYTTVWAARAAIQDLGPRRLELSLAIACAEAVLPLFEVAYPYDKRPRLAIEAAKRAPYADAKDAEAQAAQMAALEACGCAARAVRAAVAADTPSEAKAPLRAAHSAVWAAIYAVDYAVNDTDYEIPTYHDNAPADAAYYAEEAAKGSNIDLAAVIKEVLDNA